MCLELLQSRLSFLRYTYKYKVFGDDIAAKLEQYLENKKKCVFNFLSPKKYFLVTLRPSAIFKKKTFSVTMMGGGAGFALGEFTMPTLCNVKGSLSDIRMYSAHITP